MRNILHPKDVSKILEQHKKNLSRQYGVTKLGFFGSVARGEANQSSDVDIVVEMQKPDLFYLVHIKEELQEAFHRPVDIIHYREKMNPFLKSRIEEDVIYV